MRNLKFGTDGIRGKYGENAFTYDNIKVLGYLLAQTIKGNSPILIGRDTRTTGPAIANALKYGIHAANKNTAFAHILPTPAISHLTQNQEFSYGIAITASHNPPTDNGIKIFNSIGNKISNELERKLEEGLREFNIQSLPEPRSLIPQTITERALRTYVSHLLNSVSRNGFHEIKAAYDLANGASIPSMLKLTELLGLQRTYLTGIDINGERINDGVGATNPNTISQYTKQRNADVGFSFDGDADRIAICDEKGNIVHGDILLGLLSLELKRENKLANNTIVATEYSNLALDKFLAENSINTLRVLNGDKNVTERLQNQSLSFGGEFSGHIIYSDHAKTGDGILTSLKILEIMAKHQKPLSEIIPQIELNPQILINIPINEELDLNNPEIQRKIREIENEIGEKGRILVRKSGTEPKIRIMTEHPNKETAKSTAEEISEMIKEHMQ